MIDKTHIVKNNKTMLYITYAIVLAFVVFNFNTVFSIIGYILSLATPLYIAIIIAFILNIPMRRIEHLYGKKIKKRGLKRGLAIATTLILAIILIVLFSSFIIPKLGESITLIISNIFNYSNRLVTLINDTMAKFHVNYAINYESIQQALSNLDLNNLLSKSGDLLGNAGINLIFQSIGIFGFFINVITSFIMSLYLLANKETHLRQLKKVVTFLFGYKESLMIFDIGAEANHYFNGFVSGQLLECCILTSLMYAGFRLTGLPFPELIAFIIGLASLVPMFGGFVGFGISFILVLAVEPTQAIIFTICFVIIQQFEANIIYPRVVGGAVGISGLYVLLSLVVFGNLFGFFGLLIAVPSMALIYAVGSRFINIALYRNHIEVTDKSIKKMKE
ncbi:AI-2E family transporter [Candidatus Stoquefichus massiliensis]|uniref:AI-2E family transporter n=1 Tax=Candidatus Stoquefichus massiliensis TaxID=1470350 RepID=UPI000485ACCB|nr:AI-2E family transporter [Candidatus Stoquefichus massiliensis]